MKKEKTNKLLGIWMDDSNAHLIEPMEDETKIETIHSLYKSRERIAGQKPTGMRVGKNRASNNEYSKHMRKEEYQAHYYNTIGDRIRNYNEILLFGPTRAKNKLFNLLTEDKRFKNVTFHVEVENNMTKNQMKSYVKKYYRNLSELQIL